MNHPGEEERIRSSAEKKLAEFLGTASTQIEPLTPDASTREYFRIGTGRDARVACVYPEPFGEELPFLDTSNLFLSAGLPVAEILQVSGENGIVIQEDLGDLTLGKYLENADPDIRERSVDDAIGLIARIQAATGLAFETGSIASKLKFDREKLEWELEFFLEHYFQSLLKGPLNKALELSVRSEFGELARELESYSKVLTHRDFHAANLLVDGAGGLHIIDHQDARIGSAAYDLVSLLLDRITEIPDDAHLAEKRALLLSLREGLGLRSIAADDFAYEFDLVAVQRCLKAIGTFSNQAGNFGKRHYTVYIAPMFGIVSGICGTIGRFPAVREMIMMHAVNNYEPDVR